jgi:hypothetical protein
MLMYADIEREWGLDHPMADPDAVRKGRAELRGLLNGGQRPTDVAVSDLEEFRQRLGPKRNPTPQVVPSDDPVADLAEMRERLGRD